MTRTLAAAIAAAVTVAVASPALAATPIYEEAPIRYSATAPQDPVAKLKASVEKGDVKLARTAERGYLDALLRELKISPASQAVVFSKTSFQRTLISPKNPRALYFNDEIYVGYVPGGDVIEIASIDPNLGTVFYTVDQSAPAEAAPSPAAAPTKFVRETDNCLQCHGDSMTRGVPGLLVRSVFSDSAGQPMLQAGTFLTTHESPLKERWGGWYVTGTAADPHMGNTFWKEQAGRDVQPVEPRKAALPDLAGEFDASRYPTPHSDVVALMVLEHQVEAHNRITRASHGTLRALRDEKVMADALGEPIAPGHSESTRSRIRHSCEPLVEYLLFAGEAKLAGPVAGSSAFAAEFAAGGPRDSKNRSLRDFDLKSRLFRYPCSYLIYSPAVDGLPDAAKGYVFGRLGEILGGRDTSDKFAHLSPADRVAIGEILRETKPKFVEASKPADATGPAAP